MIEINNKRLLADLLELRKIGAFGKGVIRPAFSPEDMDARRWLCSKMEQAGLDPFIDGVGTVIGHSRKPGKALLIGSHTDTQPQGGWLDGALGVIYGLEIARTFKEHPDTSQYGVDVASWSDEEGTYLGMLGSKSFCGMIDTEKLEQFYDHRTNRKLTDAIRDAGLEGIPHAVLDRSRYHAYLEAHIEQGPFLEEQSLNIGIVTAIAAIRTFKIIFIGEQNHAGTTPMKYRKDAAAGLLRLAHSLTLKLENMAGPQTVWTIGSINVEPGSPSVVPGKAEMLLQIRDPDEKLLDEMEKTIKNAAANFAHQEPVDVNMEDTNPRQIGAVLNEEIQRHLADAASVHAPGKWTKMVSGAGHDAQNIAHHLPTAMLFIPSIGGISHSLQEDSKEEDIIIGCRTMATAAMDIFTSAKTRI